MIETLHEKGVEPPMVSVVIPTRDRRETLERCLDALAYQTHANYEVIVVDDGSSDDTQAFLQQFTVDHPGLQLTCLRNDTPIGANRSRNRGVRAARGEFAAFEDSDCIAQPDWLEKLMGGFTTEQVAAVTGLVKDPAPSNIYELAFKGTHRLHRAGQARRLVGGNMCIRRCLLLERPLDEDRATCATNRDGTVDVTVSGRGDEEGLFLLLRAAGYEQLAVPDAVVLHEHHYTARSFFRQALAGGGATARLVYKYYLHPRLDLLPFMLTYLTLPLLLVHPWLGLLPAVFFATALAAIVYNDLFRKGKSVGETVRSFPVLLAYYHVRLFGYLTEAIRLRLGKNEITRQRL